VEVGTHSAGVREVTEVARRKPRPITTGRLQPLRLFSTPHKCGAPKGQLESCRRRTRAMVCRSVAIDQGLWRSRRTRRSPRAEVGRHFGDGWSQSAGTSGGGKTVPFGYQEPIGRNTKGRVMMKAPPTSAFIVTQPKFLLQFFVIALDDPAVLRHADQVLEFGLWR
jgi:hypothetical protein